jgi:hypothetical protein
LALLLLISFIRPTQSNTNTTCNSFPKIFGGNTGDSNIFHIDVYNDYLALAGSTYDNSLTGKTTFSPIPYLALTSISKGGKYYWAKALSLRGWEGFVGV